MAVFKEFSFVVDTVEAIRLAIAAISPVLPTHSVRCFGLC